MRDFRDAKAMAQTLRAALAAKGFKITVGESLELIAGTSGVADWNTLAALIRREKPLVIDRSASPTPPVAEAGDVVPLFSAGLAAALQKALVFAQQRRHEYATLEHLLLALIDDADARAVMTVCNVDFGKLTRTLVGYLDNDLKRLVVDEGTAPKPTAAFQRVVQRSSLRVHELGHNVVTGANTLEALFAETRSPAVRFLGEQDMTWDRVSEIATRGSA